MPDRKAKSWRGAAPAIPLLVAFALGGLARPLVAAQPGTAGPEPAPPARVVVVDGGPVDMANAAAGGGPSCAPGKQCCYEISSCRLTAPTAGHAVIAVWARITIDHTQGVAGGDRILIGSEASRPHPDRSCPNRNQSINASDFEIAVTEPSDPAVEWMLGHKRVFAQRAGSMTYYMNGMMASGFSQGDGIVASRMICTFIPD
jgi:hypothetical protein